MKYNRIKLAQKLKRTRYMRICILVPLTIILCPLFALEWIGRKADVVLTWISDGYEGLERKLIRLFKWDEEAIKQYNESPAKFDRVYKPKMKGSTDK